MIKRFGILGTGHLASFICKGLGNTDWPGKILVSPHNPEKAQHFAVQYNATIVESNQRLIESSDIVLLAVRPDQYRSLLRSLDWPSAVILLSAMAGVRLASLAAITSAITIVRAMPISAAEFNQSPTTLYPADPEVGEFLSLIGSVIALQNEEEFEMATVNAAVYGWHFALIDTLVRANCEAGLSTETATRLVTETLTAAALVAANSEVDHDVMLASLATPGGITAEGLTELVQQDAFAPWAAAFERVANRLRKQ